MGVVDFERRGLIGVLTVNRPEAMNALNVQVIGELDQIVADLGTKRELRALVLTGAGPKAFVAGADIKEMEHLDAAEARAMAERGQGLMQKIEDLPFPVVVAMNGFALGGGLELALAGDFIIAAETAKWGLPEVTLGLIPGYGGTQRLTRNLGRALARRVALTGELFTARQGAEWGLVSEVVPADQTLPRAIEIAETIARRAPLAVGWVKTAINHGADRRLAEGLALEVELFGRSFETKDHVEGIAAFVAKRSPDFRGN